ncbi:nucleotidyltransferase domain-containing protein [Roseofilum sp. BLCC_M154]|uniref:Nucleotidyltransferase domain-containing protein n=1 Tax=Roseofilum acuticapitatum BLCC-M154 TaxID=3022444 RepID=A0ABT7ATL0_9CYAN|nr:nucleotidyltransferase domain-containing protein [Roseofilum acuticapitatum]MDJ1170248.1 nucleotidyltransferase domain-containing protein [Roseofilum acuticapitatum BLCC-M154]
MTPEAWIMAQLPKPQAKDKPLSDKIDDLIGTIESSAQPHLKPILYARLIKWLKSKMKKETLDTILKEACQGLKALYGKQIDQIILYGSQARGDAEPDSDIDLLIILKQDFQYSEESNRISQTIADLCLEYNTLISCALASSRQFQEYNNSFFRNIRREGIPL